MKVDLGILTTPNGKTQIDKEIITIQTKEKINMSLAIILETPA